MSHGVPNIARREVKFIAYDTRHHTLLHWLHVNPAGFIPPYPDRWVNNIYFDTHDCAAYAENLSGVSSRNKVRYRWYGGSRKPTAGILEIKLKRNCFGWKLRFKVNKTPYQLGGSWRTIRQLISDQLPAPGKKWLEANPVPVFINRYFRRYLISGDRRIRVTIDSQQGVWEQRLKPFPNFTHPANLPKISVVEFKFDRKDHDLASQFIQGMPIRADRHSKYVTGVRAIRGL
jgi:hypothetical protein